MVLYIVNLSVPWLEGTVDSLNGHLCKTDIYSWSLPFFPLFILTLYIRRTSLWDGQLVPVLKVSVFERVKCTWQSVLFCLFLFHFVPHIKQEMTCFCFGNVKEYRCTLDCEQPLIFFRFSKGSARMRERWAAKLQDARNEAFVMPLPSRAFSLARGHLRVSGVLLNGQRKKRDCS